MADNVEQVFSLDASDAINALTQLDSNFSKVASTLGSLTGQFSTFNSAAQSTVTSLKNIGTAAREADANLAKLQSNKALSGGNAGAGFNSAGIQSSAAQVNSAYTSAAQSAKNTAVVVSQTGNATVTSMNSSARATSSYAVSFETLSRVIATQLIVRTMSAIRDAVKDSLNSFLQFNQAVAEIQTIAGNQSIGELGGEVRQLSDAFNAPILDVAKAKYQALSNGFTSAADSATLMTAALKFSKVGISDTTDAVNLIGGALNAYGKGAESAEDFAAVFVQTIQQGRVVGSELATAMSRVYQIASQSGVSIQELGAAFSSITVGGVKAAEAATGIRSTLQGLLKPSSDMQAALHKIGYASGEEAIAALGFQGTLLALKGTTDGTVSSLEKLFPNIRAIGAVLRETTNGVDVFKDHLQGTVGATKSLLDKKYKLRIDSDGEKVAADLNKIKNVFTVDLGSKVATAVKSVTDQLGGFATVSNALQAFGPPLIAASLSVVALSGAIAVASLSSRAFASDLSLATGKVNLLKAGIGLLGEAMLAVSAGKFIAAQLSDSFSAPYKDAIAQTDSLYKDRAEKASAQQAQDEAIFGEQAKLRLQESSAIRAGIYEQLGDAKARDGELISGAKTTIGKLTTIRGKYEQDLIRQSNRAETEVINSKKRSADLQGQYADALFNHQLDQQYRTASASNQIRRSEAESSHALFLARQGSSKLGDAKTPDQREGGENTLKRAEAYAQQAVQIARGTGSLHAQQQAELALLGILKLRLGAEESYQTTQKHIADQAAQAAAAEGKRRTDTQAAEKKFLTNADLFSGKKNQLLSKEQRDKAVKNAKDALATIQRLNFGPDSHASLSDFFGFNKFKQEFEKGITVGEINDLNASGDALEKLNKQIDGSIQSVTHLVKFAPDPTALQKMISQGKTAADVVVAYNEQIKNQVKHQKDLNGVLAKQATLQDDADKARQQAIISASREHEGVGQKVARETSLGISNAVGLVATPEGRQAGSKLKDLRDDLAVKLQAPEFDQKSLDAITEKANKLFATNGAFFNTDVEQLGQAVSHAQRYLNLSKELQKTRAENPHAEEDLNSIRLNSTQGAAASKAVLDENARKAQAAAAAKQLGPTTQPIAPNLREASIAAAQFANNMERAEEAARGAASAAGNISVNPLAIGPATQPVSEHPAAQVEGVSGRPGFSAGGVVPQYFDAGGTSKGIDRIAAMLAPGERVVDPTNSIKFFSQLQAIGAGVAPRQTAPHSGDSFNFGDINVNGAGNPKTTAREVINAIRREQRRGSGWPLKSA